MQVLSWWTHSFIFREVDRLPTFHPVEEKGLLPDGTAEALLGMT